MAGKSLPPFGTYTETTVNFVEPHQDNAVLVIEGRVDELGPFRREPFAHMEADARIAFRPVPVAPVPFDLAQPDRQLVGGRLDFLQAHDVRLLAFEPFLQLCLPRPDAVDVPRGDLHKAVKILCNVAVDA